MEVEHFGEPARKGLRCREEHEVSTQVVAVQLAMTGGGNQQQGREQAQAQDGRQAKSRSSSLLKYSPGLGVWTSAKALAYLKWDPLRDPNARAAT